MSSRSIVFSAALAAAAMMHGAAAEAALGRAYATVETDRAVFGATLKSTSGAGFTLHTLTLANGGVVAEYTALTARCLPSPGADRDDRTFARSWAITSTRCKPTT